MTTTAPLLDTLTDEQRAAVTATDRFVRVSAGAGSGKTRTLAARLCWLLEQGAEPAEICCLTFTRAAAAEIRERVERSVPCALDDLAVSTFHERAIHDGPPLLDLKVAEETDQDAAIRSLYEGPAKRPPKDVPGKRQLLQAIARYEALGGCLKGRTRELKAIELVNDRLAEAGLIPMWELVPRLYRAQERDEVRTYQHVLIDESQDTTPTERGVALRLNDHGSTHYAVGDERQSIMGFRCAEPDPDESATHRLTRTFRFGESIAQVSNALHVGNPITGNRDVQSTVKTVDINDLDRFLLIKQETAILVRTHADARVLADRYPNHTRHLQRDPFDIMSAPADKVARVLADGLAPILTVHSAKGREFERVIVIGPSTMQWGEASHDPEERRVLYVAMTRAKKELVLVTGQPREQPNWRVRSCGIGGGPW